MVRRTSQLILSWVHSKFGCSRSLERRQEMVMKWKAYLHKCVYFPKALCECSEHMCSEKIPGVFQIPSPQSPPISFSCSWASFVKPPRVILISRGPGRELEGDSNCLQAPTGRSLAQLGTSCSANCLDKVWKNSEHSERRNKTGSILDGIGLSEFSHQVLGASGFWVHREAWGYPPLTFHRSRLLIWQTSLRTTGLGLARLVLVWVYVWSQQMVAHGSSLYHQLLVLKVYGTLHRLTVYGCCHLIEVQLSIAGLQNLQTLPSESLKSDLCSPNPLAFSYRDKAFLASPLS